MCGGTTSTLADIANQAGLSPRVRGNQAGHLIGIDYDGSIPACAGEPCPAAVVAAIRTVYPRVCGGTLARPPAKTTNRGLSPRVRGNLYPYW